MRKEDKRHIPYKGSPHKFRVPDAYLKNPKLWEARIKKEEDEDENAGEAKKQRKETKKGKDAYEDVD